MSRKIIFCAGCPIEGCKNTNPNNWIHLKDRGNIYIYDDGYLECKDCGTKGLFMDWIFDCGIHALSATSGYDFYKYLLSLLGQLEVDEDFVDSCLEAIRKQRKRSTSNLEKSNNYKIYYLKK